MSVALVCLGSAVLAWWGRLRAGRSAAARSWAHGSARSALNAMCAVPSVGAALVTAGLTPAASHGSALASLVCLVTLPIFVVLGLWGGLQLPLPRWYLPLWARERAGTWRTAGKGPRPRREQPR